MKRGLIVLTAALLTNSVFGDTIFEAIDDAALTGELTKLKAQVTVLEADVNGTSKDFETKGYTPLTYAIDKLEGQTRIEAVNYLLANKANANQKATLQASILRVEQITPEETPLTAALFTKEWSIVKAILDSGADPSVQLRHTNRDFKHPQTEYFGQKYVANAKAKVTAMDIAVYLKDPALVELLKTKAPKLTATYNVNNLWYSAFTSDLAGFKKLVKAGQVPTAYDVAYLIHYGKKDYLTFLDAAAVFKTKEKEDYVEGSFSFSLVEDTPIISALSEYLDKNTDLATKDIPAFSKGLQALPVDWKKVRLWGAGTLFNDPSGEDYWNLDKIVTSFSHRPELTRAFLIALHAPELDGYFATTDDKLWIEISESGTKFDLRYKKSTDGENKSGNLSIVDASGGFLLCDFQGFGKFWVKTPQNQSPAIEMQSDLKKTYKTTSYAFNRWTRAEWNTQVRPGESGK